MGINNNQKKEVMQLPVTYVEFQPQGGNLVIPYRGALLKFNKLLFFHRCILDSLMDDGMTKMVMLTSFGGRRWGHGFAGHI